MHKQKNQLNTYILLLNSHFPADSSHFLHSQQIMSTKIIANTKLNNPKNKEGTKHCMDMVEIYQQVLQR